MRPRVLAAALAALLAGCTMGPAYQRPALDVPQSFRGQEGGVGEDRSLADLAWWDMYQDKTLQALVRTALAQNRDVKIAAARVQEARALAGVSRLARYPQIDANAVGERGRVFQSGDYATGALFLAQVELSFELDFWHRLASLDEAARANLLASEYAREAVRTGLIGDVANAWFNLLALDEQLRITQVTLVARQRFFDLTQSKFNRGASSGLDVSRAQATLNAAQSNIPDLQRLISQAENQLRILLGENPGPVIREATELRALPAAPDVPPGLPSSLLERRPDLRQSESVLVAAHANVLAAKAALFPTISLTSNLGAESFELSKLFSGSTGIWSVGANVLQPLLNAQRSGYQVDAARAREEQALLQYQSAVAQAFRDVSDALVAKSTFILAAQATEQQVNALRDARSRVLRRYEVGYSNYFEVIDADTALYIAELQLAQSRRNHLQASVQLYKALGGGWEGKPETQQ